MKPSSVKKVTANTANIPKPPLKQIVSVTNKI